MLRVLYSVMYIPLYSGNRAHNGVYVSVELPVETRVGRVVVFGRGQLDMIQIKSYRYQRKVKWRDEM